MQSLETGSGDEPRNRVILLLSLILLSISGAVIVAATGILIFRRHELIRRKLVHLLGRLDSSDTNDVYQVSQDSCLCRPGC